METLKVSRKRTDVEKTQERNGVARGGRGIRGIFTNFANTTTFSTRPEKVARHRLISHISHSLCGK